MELLELYIVLEAINKAQLDHSERTKDGLMELLDLYIVLGAINISVTGPFREDQGWFDGTTRPILYWMKSS